MLVLTRLPQEKVFIHVPPSKVERTIEVVYISRSTRIGARLGFEAEPDIAIVREEVPREKGATGCSENKRS